MCQMQCILASLRNKAAGKRNGDAYLKSEHPRERERKETGYTRVKHILDLLK